MTELYQLRTFAAVAETGHLTHASERLHISQPAVSAQIKALEQELEVRLFERTHSGMRLTVAGRRLLDQAEKVLAMAEEMKQIARSLKGEIAGKLRIGTLSDPEFIRLGDFSGRTVQRFPSLELEFHNEISGDALDGVRDGDLDAAFYVGEIGHPAITGLKLREMVFRLVAPASWAGRVRLDDWSAMAAQPWIHMPANSAHNQLMRAIFREHGFQPSKLVEADQEAVIASLVISGLGVTLLRENLALELQRRGEICIWDKAGLRTTLSFIYLKERAQDPFILALLEVLKETWASGSDSAPESSTALGGRGGAGHPRPSSVVP